MKPPTAIALVVVLGGFGPLAACSRITPGRLAESHIEQLEVLERNPTAAGDQVYEGRVYPLGASMPLFSYERRVKVAGPVTTSTHITHDMAGAVVVTQSAVHSADYALHRAEMIHRQTGVTAAVDVNGAEAVYTLNDGQRQLRRRERLQAPLVAGPTMFGHILAHWDELTRGTTLPIRFAVLERGESIGFALDRVAAPAGRTIIRMKPSSLLVRLAVDPTFFQFDTDSRRILEYTGRVPPLEQMGDRLVTLDARVAYSFMIPAFH